MAITNTSSLHSRSISMPPASHPLDANIEHHFRRLRASQAGPCSFSSSSISQNLFCIKDLYEQINNSIHLPHNQKGLTHGQVEEVLEGSLAVLDASSSSLDVVSQMKESILELQSSIRRGNGNEGIRAYLASRKKINKIVSKSLTNLKNAYKKHACLENNGMTVKMLKEAQVITLATLKSVLSFAMGKKAVSQTRGWSLVKNLVKSKHVSGELEKASQVEKIDSALYSVSEKQLGTETTMVFLKQLEALELTIHEIEDGLELVSRCLVKTRVSLLNVLNH